MPASADPSAGNLLLRALRGPDLDLIEPHLEEVSYPKGAALFEAGAEVGHVTFPCGQAAVSLIVTTADGRGAETATVGREGVVGSAVGRGRLPASARALVQVGGVMLRLEAGRLQDAERRSSAVRDLFARHADCLLAQALQTAACNALHPIEQRCLRWLLSLQDRTGGDTLPVTHELLAGMLGVQRTYLTRVLRSLQEQGLVRVGRGRITVLDRRGAEAAACECHGRVRDHYATVLGAVYGADGIDRIEAPGEAEGTAGARGEPRGALRR